MTNGSEDALGAGVSAIFDRYPVLLPESEGPLPADFFDQQRRIQKSRAVELAALLNRAGPVSYDDFNRVHTAAGRIYGPMILYAVWENMSAPDLGLAASLTWSMAEHPERQLGRSDWRAIFGTAGFTVDGKPAPRPIEPVRLWRGALPPNRRGWSWTNDLVVAQHFASGHLWSRPEVGRVWTTLAPPASILAVIGEAGRESEGEYVVDTRGLKIVDSGEEPRPDPAVAVPAGHWDEDGVTDGSPS